MSGVFAAAGARAALTYGDFALFFLAGAAGLVLALMIRFGLESIRSSYQTAENEFQMALDSTDLKVLSSYLKDKLGALSIRDYVGKTTPRERVDRYIERLTVFVGTDESLMQENEVPSTDQNVTSGSSTPPIETLESPPEGPASRVDKRADDPAILKEARTLVENGTIWTALATIRRDIEQRLKPLTEGRPLQSSDIAEKFGTEVARHYDRFRRVANRAIHGEDVHLESARAAINSARVVYQALNDTLHSEPGTDG